MKKLKILAFILLLLGLGIWNYFYHKVTYSYWIFKKDNPDFPKLNIKNDYYTFFFNHDTTPLYTFKNDILTKYEKYAFLNKKSGLFLPHQETLADLKYIQDIQYLASFRNTYEAKQLYTELNYVTNLSPYRPGIYTLGLLVIPAWTRWAKDLNFVEKLKNWKQTVKLWEKWIFFNCDKNKINNILKLSDKEYFKYAYSKTWDFYKQNMNPCKNQELPQQLGFDYFYYLRDLPNTIKYYKIAGFFKNALAGVIWMVAVANWILWEHEKWMYLLLNKASNIYQKLQKEKSEKEKKLISSLLNDTIKRAQAELNFYIVNQADQKHSECNKQYKCLIKNWYIKQEIENLFNQCKQHFNPYQIKSFKDLFSQNISNSIENAKCFLLGLNLQSWYIKNWQLYTVLRKNWAYFWNPDLQTWWEK